MKPHVNVDDVIITWYNNYVMLDALDIYSQKCVIASCIWNHLEHMCAEVCHVENVSHVIHKYYNIPLVSLIKNAKILKFTSCEIKHNYCEQKVRVLATLIYAQCMGASSHFVMVNFIVCGCTGFSSHIITVDFIVCGCMGTSSHIITVDFWHMPGVVWVRALSGPSLRASLGLHLFNKLRWWLTAPSGTVRDCRCCAVQLWCN